jgi:hypothetical protein
MQLNHKRLCFCISHLLCALRQVQTPQIVKIGNVSWTFAKNELTVVHTNICWAFLELCLSIISHLKESQ